MQKKTMNGYDETKKMLNILRGFNTTKSKSIREQVEMGDLQRQDDPTVSDKPLKDDITVINDVDIKMLSTDDMDMELLDDQKNTISTMIDSFREQVSQIANLEPGFTLSQTQIRLDGVLPDEDINFVLIAGEESGLYINADMLKIDEQTLIILQKLQKFEMAFKDGFDPIIRQRQNN
jgi:hypothetical protein